jgi:signal transduction histidine kinase
MRSTPSLRAALVCAGQIAITFAAFAAANAFAVLFELENDVSILFPATAVSILACMYFGVWAAIGIILGTIATPWNASITPYQLVIAGVLSAAEGLIPYFVFRARRDLTSDLRDMKSLAAFLIFGTIVNTAVSAISGNLLIVRHAPGVAIVWREVFVWWIADFVAALLIATPVLAFGGAFFRSREKAGQQPRTITNALQIITVIILLGFAASFAIRTYLLNHEAYAGKQHKILVVCAIIDAIVFLILVSAAAMLLFTISRPFAQLRGAIGAVREGEIVDPTRIDSRYQEFKSIAETLAETSRDLRHREAQLKQQTEKAIRATRAQSDFLAKMSHELRTPLNSIIGFSDLLGEQEETITRAKRLAFLQNVGNSAKHLLTLINDLLDIAKVESGKMQLHIEPVDLRMSIANTVASTQALFVRKHQEVEVETPDEPMITHGDSGRIEQILLNLLSNANKFSPDGDRITIRGDAEETMWKIEVADHGIGISPNDQQRIFDEFEQVQTKGTQIAGTGLGLALARRFAEAHGGEISVSSALGAGAVFRVRLPRG